MFQNISEEIETEIREEEENTFKNIIRKILTKQNIALYILSFMISMVGFNQNIFPFGLAIIAAACSLGIPIGIMVLVTTVGTFIGFGAASTITYVMTVVVLVAMIMIFKPKITGEEENEKIRLSKYLFFSCLLVQAVKLIASNILVYNILESIMFCIVTCLFYKIFVNSIAVITEYKEKKVFSVEELIGVSLVISIAISAFGEMNILGLSLRNILCIIMVLVLGWKNGVLVGGTAGITIGVVLGIIGVNEPLMIASFALSGMLAGILNRFGKIGVIIGFVIGNAILTYISNGNITAIIHLREILIASIGLLLIPKTIEINIDDIVGRKKYLPVAKERILEEAHKDTIYKLNSVSETISEIAKTYDTKENEPIETREEFEKENEELFRNDLLNNISNLTQNALYDDIVNEQNHILTDIYIRLNHVEEIEEKDLISIFEKHNNYIIGVEENKELKRDIEVMVKSINYTYRISKLNFLWKQKLNESRKNISNELNGVSKVISTMAEDMNDRTQDKVKKQEEEIKLLLEQKNVKIKDISIKTEKNGKYNIKLYLPKDWQENEKIIETILSRTYNQKIKLQKQQEIDAMTVLKMYQTEDKFNIQVGIAKTTKNKSKISGDSYLKVRLSDGKQLLAISDGMGSGENAQKSSKIAIKMLERLLKDGFDKDASLSLINSTMVLNANEDMYSTLDIAILDLFDGSVECIKNGACPTYIKNKNSVEQIQSITLPAGILDKIDLVVYEKDLHAGDILVMCSDGVLDSKEEETEKGLWLKEILEKINTDNVQKIADILLGEAIDNGLGIAKDDMTILIAKITQKEN